MLRVRGANKQEMQGTSELHCVAAKCCGKEKKVEVCKKDQEFWGDGLQL